MKQWEYCEVDFDGSTTFVYFYDEAGEYIDHPLKHPRLGLMLATLGHDGWEIISSWWRNNRQVTYMLKRPCERVWTAEDRVHARQSYVKTHPKDAKSFY